MDVQELMQGLEERGKRSTRGGKRIPGEGSVTRLLYLKMREMWREKKQPIFTPEMPKGQAISYCQGINAILREEIEEGKDQGVTAKTIEGTSENDWKIEFSKRAVRTRKAQNKFMLGVLAQMDEQLPQRGEFNMDEE
jgi:hypothetical protein